MVKQINHREQLLAVSRRLAERLRRTTMFERTPGQISDALIYQAGGIRDATHNGQRYLHDDLDINGSGFLDLLKAMQNESDRARGI